LSLFFLLKLFRCFFGADAMPYDRKGFVEIDTNRAEA
jgi:hypothetical protein